MSHERARRILVPIAICAALIAALLVLTPNLDDLALRPGTRPPRREKIAADPENGDRRPFDLDVRFLRFLLLVAFTASLGIVLVSALFSRLLRRWLYFAIGLFGALLVFDFFASKIPSSTTVPPDSLAPRPALGASVEAEPRDWSHVVVAIGLSLGAGALLVLCSSCIARWWCARPSRRADGEIAWELESLAQRMLRTDTSTDLVLRCYREMLDLLSCKEHVPHASLTPREFAGRLAGLGLHTEAIDRLTKIFELVRYGHRDSGPFTGSAVADLESIRRSSPPVDE